MEAAMSLLLGLGLSAACGFRVFVPLLCMSLANHSGHLTLSPGFAWIGTWPALITFATATLLEVGGYYFPWIDNALDVVATPAAIIAGTIAMASQIGEVSPLIRWSVAAIAGGGVCAVVQSCTVLLRGASTGASGGLSNFLVSTLELMAALFVSVVTLIAPLIAVTMLVVFGVMVFKKLRRPAVA